MSEIPPYHYTYLNRSHRNTRFRLSRMSVLMKFSVERSSSDHQPCAVVVVRREDGAFLDRSTNWNGFYTHQSNLKKYWKEQKLFFESRDRSSVFESCSKFPDQNESWPYLTLKKFIRMFTYFFYVSTDVSLSIGVPTRCLAALGLECNDHKLLRWKRDLDVERLSRPTFHPIGAS